MRLPIDPSIVVVTILAVAMAIVAYVKDPSRYFGREGGFKASVIASVIGMLTPGGPMVTVPLLVVLANSGTALPLLVAYMTAWSLFGLQRMIYWEAPLMGWPFVGGRVLSSFAFPVLAGWLISVFHHD
jgi:uncharacterized membrane protein YraQ (UPF0718 family)